MNTNFDTLKAALTSLSGLTPEDQARALTILTSLKADPEREEFMRKLCPIAERIRNFSEEAERALEQMKLLVKDAEQSAKTFKRKKRERSCAKRESEKLKKLESSFEHT